MRIFFTLILLEFIPFFCYSQDGIEAQIERVNEAAVEISGLFNNKLYVTSDGNFERIKVDLDYQSFIARISDETYCCKFCKCCPCDTLQLCQDVCCKDCCEACLKDNVTSMLNIAFPEINLATLKEDKMVSYNLPVGFKYNATVYTKDGQSKKTEFEMTESESTKIELFISK